MNIIGWLLLTPMVWFLGYLFWAFLAVSSETREQQLLLGIISLITFVSAFWGIIFLNGAI